MAVAPDYTTVLNAINTSLQNIYTVLNNPTNNDGITQKLDQILLKVTPATITPTEEITQIDYTQALAELSSQLSVITSRLDTLQTASLWVIGIGTASIILYIIYRLLANFIEF